MDNKFPGITKMNDPSLQSKASEKMSEAKDGAAGSVRDDFHQPASKWSDSQLKKKIKQAEARNQRLIREQNRLRFAVTEKEAAVKLLRKTLRDKSVRPPGYNGEDSCEQRKRQLENNIDKMRMKVTGAKELQKTYQHIHDHLQQEVREMEQARGRKEHAVSTGRAEVERLSRQLQAEAAALESSQGRLDELLRKKGEMKIDQLNAEERNLNRTPENQKGREIDGDEEKEEGAHSFHVTDHQRCDVSGASQSDRKLVEDMEALREALGVCHVQEIGPRVASLWATEERLLAEVTRYQDEIRQGAKAFAELELQHTKLKFTPSATRSDELRAEVKAEQDEKALRVQRLQADLKRSQALLDTAERGVDNLHFRMSCVPVEGLSSESPTDSMEKLKDIRARLPMLLQRASEQEADSGLDQETVYTLCEQLNAMESRNAKALSVPTDAPHLSDGEEDSAPSRAEIKRRSSRLIEAGRKKSSRGRRKQ